MKNIRLYMDVIAHLSILNYTLHNVNDGDKYKDKFFKRYDNYINNDNRCFLNNLKYRILKYRNESIGNYEEAIKYIDIIDTEGYLKNDKVLYYEMMKDKALVYKKIGNEDKAVDLLLNICRDAAKLELFRTALDVLEEIVAWGYEDTIPRQLCISLILIAIKTNKQDIRKEIIIDLRNLKEIIEIKKEAKEQIKNNKSLKDTLEEFQLKSNLDPLTNAYNRRYLNQVLDSNKCLIKKYTTLAMIDVDDFKGINDKFGHLIGDRALIEISTMIKFVIGINGKIFRYGGDEFFILYNHSSSKEGENILRKIFCKSKKLRINHIIKGHEIALSIGGITIVEDERIRIQMNKIVKRCDKILYDVKEKGKNQYRLYYKI
ncbi:GGDEF domain-containing protein [Clostridium baratii]|uniref:GGDEF domain-containing protein n=1 Tax=Clostridium baratii TaxID=1561 RepID=UPI00242FC0E2|nr:GGDEF domain-containing protein [Clostridium baratii]